MRFWIVLVSTATLFAFTAAAILEERRRLLETEAVHASTLLEHLAHMPEFQRDAREAEARLTLLHGSLTAVGGRLDHGAGEDSGVAWWTVLARRQLALRDADLSCATARSRPPAAWLCAAVVIHSVHGQWRSQPFSSRRSGSCAGTCWRRSGPSPTKSA
jgi:hypothetical protein